MNKKISSTCNDFINDAKITELTKIKTTDLGLIRSIISKSISMVPLKPDETAILLSSDSDDINEEIFNAAKSLKEKVYGNRIVLFAPLYIGNLCVNSCKYCGFRKELDTTIRKTLTTQEIENEINSLIDEGHKRLILVFGEHLKYSPEFIADTVRQVYSIKKGKNAIRRVNINAAPLDIDGFKTVKQSGIGTYQIFQETYHHGTYSAVHPANTPKGDYLYRLDGLSRAYEAGCDDVGVGALFGLYDWKFDLLSLVTHANFLMEKHAVGPHTISFPRLRPVPGSDIKTNYLVNDRDFMKLVAVLRLSVPYTGLILTTRESEKIRTALLPFGVSQIDAGSKIELGGYSTNKNHQKEAAQFSLADNRSLEEIVNHLIKNNYIPSFCTACYRLGRTGEQFFEYAIPGFIEHFCTPNAILTLQEYINDYCKSGALKDEANAKINLMLEKIEPKQVREKVRAKLKKINTSNTRDICI